MTPTVWSRHHDKTGGQFPWGLVQIGVKNICQHSWDRARERTWGACAPVTCLLHNPSVDNPQALR